MPGELSRLKLALDEWIACAPVTRMNALLHASDISSILERAAELKAKEEREARIKELEDFAR
jgi:hypothetical protein